MSSNDIHQTAGDTTIAPAVIIAMAERIFPEYYQIEEIKEKMKMLQLERAKLFDAKVSLSLSIST
jgi:hypothetical protein